MTSEILIIGNAKVAHRYAADRNLAATIVSHDLALQLRGMQPDKIILVDGWSKVVDEEAGTYLRIYMARGAIWESGVAA
jgi:hypothetical protein